MNVCLNRILAANKCHKWLASGESSGGLLRCAAASGSGATTSRGLHVSRVRYGKRNFRKFMIPNVRGVFEHNKLPQPLLEKEFDFPVCRDTLHIRYPGYWFGRKFVYVPEMAPQLVVPDLDGFDLKPYVSHRTPDIFQSEFTARDLFNATHADTIIEKFKNGEEISVSVSKEDIQRARIKARQTGSDLFIDGIHSGFQS